MVTMEHIDGTGGLFEAFNSPPQPNLIFVHGSEFA